MKGRENALARDRLPFAGRTSVAQQAAPSGALRAHQDPLGHWSPSINRMARVEITHESRADGRMTEPRHETKAPECRPRIRVLVNPNSGEKAGIPTNTAEDDEVQAVLEPHFP